MHDPYIYPNGTLINKLEITDYDKLNQAEADIGFLKLIDIDSVDTGKLDERTIKAIHKHIFEDIFDWAGEYRTVPIFKEEYVLPRYSIPYTEPKKINTELRKCIKDLKNTKWSEMDIDEISYTFARKLALLWKVHPFRDGNTRTTLSFAYLFAKNYGIDIDMTIFMPRLSRKKNEEGRLKTSVRDKFVLACLDEKDYPEVNHLAKMIKVSMISAKEKKEQALQSSIEGEEHERIHK